MLQPYKDHATHTAKPHQHHMDLNEFTLTKHSIIKIIVCFTASIFVFNLIFLYTPDIMYECFYSTSYI